MSAEVARPVRAGETSPVLPADAVEVGRVLGAFGVQGGIKVKPYAGDPQALFSSKRWYLQPPEGSLQPGLGRVSLGTTLLRVISARTQGDTIVATVHDVADRDAAEALKGARLFVPRSSFPTPESDEFYWVDLIGLDVHNRHAEALGTVVGLIETGPHCVMRVQPAAPEAGELLIPFVDAYVVQVDLPARRIVVDWERDY